ncbi:MAG: CAP domain-containing protein [Methanothrix sp.]|nr:CAP domain-containing protein [Methanothrix sp.]
MHKNIIIILFMLSAVLVATVEAELKSNEKQEILAAQNRYRAEVNVTALNWSENLSHQAQECADYNAANFLPLGRQKHCPKSGFGQNIALATTSLHKTLTQMVDQWGEERSNFINGEYPSVSATGSLGAVSHYTQIIWQETAEVGCAKANSSGYEILVCDYTPRGNINGTAVYAAGRPKAVEVGATNEYKTLTNNFAKMPERSIIINTVFNRPVSCYSTTPV